ncbi:MAG: LytTR family DNA-binding domain-containing protein [Candidatus Nanopelagicales bacterium]
MSDQPTTAGLRVLAVDDEAPARAELAYLLERDPRVEVVLTAADGAEALRTLESTTVDALFVDIRMPGLDGLDLARILRRFSSPPAVVFVSAYDSHAVEAFDLRAVDYVMKPVREERLAEAVGRVVDSRGRGSSAEPVADPADDDQTIAVELGGVTRFVKRSEVLYVEAHGDYARLVTADGRHLVRVSLALLEEEWADAGFVRIHRRYLVPLRAIDEVRSDGTRMSVRVGDAILSVSRRHTRELRDRLVRGARPGR